MLDTLNSRLRTYFSACSYPRVRNESKQPRSFPAPPEDFSYSKLYFLRFRYLIIYIDAWLRYQASICIYRAGGKRYWQLFQPLTIPLYQGGGGNRGIGIHFNNLGALLPGLPPLPVTRVVM